jgi:hypothetical protein
MIQYGTSHGSTRMLSQEQIGLGRLAIGDVRFHCSAGSTPPSWPPPSSTVLEQQHAPASPGFAAVGTPGRLLPVSRGWPRAAGLSFDRPCRAPLTGRPAACSPQRESTHQQAGRHARGGTRATPYLASHRFASRAARTTTRIQPTTRTAATTSQTPLPVLIKPPEPHAMPRPRPPAAAASFVHPIRQSTHT